MKTLISCTFIFALSFSLFLPNSLANDGEKAAIQLRDQVLKVIGQPNLTLDETVRVRVKFMVNAYDEIVVIHTEADNDHIGWYITNKLNYEKVDIPSSEFLNHKIPYYVWITFKAA